MKNARIADDSLEISSDEVTRQVNNGEKPFVIQCHGPPVVRIILMSFPICPLPGNVLFRSSMVAPINSFCVL